MAASIAPECNDIKEKYDTCFLKWYSEKYLRGNTTSNECEDLFAKYKTCLTVCLLPLYFAHAKPCLKQKLKSVGLQKTLKERGIDTMLEEARKSTPETDAEYNRRT
ncbi:hypothetical protein BJX62DRAFT_239448 [Aspergillus germanicus]